MKQRITIRIDKDLIEWTKNQSHKLGVKYQTLINMLLRQVKERSNDNKLILNKLKAIEQKLSYVSSFPVFTQVSVNSPLDSAANESSEAKVSFKS